MSDHPPAFDAAPTDGIPAETPPVLLVHQAGRITHANQAALALWQLDEGALTGEFFSSLFADKDTADNKGPKADLWLKILDSHLNHGITLELRCGHASSPENGDGVLEVNVHVEKLSDVIYLATLQRATSQKILSAPASIAPARAQPPEIHPAAAPLFQPQTSLSEHRLAPMLLHGAVGFFELEVATGRATCSPTWKRMLGYEDTGIPETIEAWRGLIHPDDSFAAPDRPGKRASARQRPFDVEFRMRHQNGHWLWVQSVGVQVLSDTGEIERVVGINLDVSERKEIEEASLTNDERLDLLGSDPIGVFDLDFAHNTHWFSPGWAAILGFRQSEMDHGLDTFSAAIPNAQEIGVEAWIRNRAGDRVAYVGHELLLGRDGQAVSVLLGLHLVVTRKRELTRVVGFVSPLAASETRGAPAPLMEQAFAALAEGVITADATGRIVSINPAACRLLRVVSGDVIGQPATEVFRLVQRETGLPADETITRAFSETDPQPQFTDSALPPESPTDAPRPIIWTARTVRDVSGSAIGAVILFRDPGEIALTADELLKANRLESLGIVAGGIAHDFNDLLATILGGISLAKEKHDPAALEESEKACLSAKGLTKQLLTFAKGGSIAHSVVGADELLNAATKLAAAGSDAAISIEVAEGTEPVRVDRLQMTQVLQNLVINALQSMPGPPHRPRVQLRAANTTLVADQIPPLPPGDYVEIEIRDNGAGIPPDNLQKIFDPFFTTRKHGTGLGLATALSIVRKHGGQIGVDSTVGEGTVFAIFLPRANAPAAPQAQAAPSSRFRTGRILFMDDDPRITALTATMLESLDYKYDIAKDGAEAVQLYQRYFNVGRPYDAVILDVTVVGGMGGEECFKALRDCDSDVRAIISSGYDHDATARNFIDQGFCGYLTKPYRVADLGKVLKDVLG